MAHISLSLVSLCLVTLVTCYYDPDKYHYETKRIELPVDHFSFANTDTYELRYLISKQFFRKPGAPVLFYSGNEGDVTLYARSTGLMWEWAEKMGALVVFSEHRYYGKSLPYGKSTKVEHMGYLTTEQALADFALLVTHIKLQVHGAADSPFIAFGGSYGGMLATWMRMKYPHLIQGVIASSAPIWQFVDMVECDALPKVITRTFKNSGDNCELNIRKSWSQFEKFGKTESGREKLEKIFNTCTKIDSESAAMTLSNWVSGSYFNLAMFDYPYPVDYFEPLPAWPIKKACAHLKDKDLEGEDLLKAVEKAITVYYNNLGTQPCLNVSQQAKPEVSDGFENWWYQACTEIIGPYCTGKNDMFPIFDWSLADTVKDCSKKFGVTPRPQWMRNQYGGKNLRYTSNIIFTNGDLDPWSAGGVLEKDKDLLPPSVYQIMIKDAAHHLEIRGSNKADPPQLSEARKKMLKITEGWIDEYQHRDVIENTCRDEYTLKEMLLDKSGLLAIATALSVVIFLMFRCCM